MKASTVLGIDAGGTHTDAVLITGHGADLRLAASAKVKTRYDDLPASVREVLAALAGEPGSDGAAALAAVERVTLGTTLAVNALVQGRAGTVGLALSAGPGLNPARFALGEHVCVAPGGLDHRGVEVSPLQTDGLARQAAAWRDAGVAAVACVGKFSPRNPAHERVMGAAVAKASGLPVTLGHRLSGRLNFPRRVATAYYNAAVQRLHNAFLDAVEAALADAGIPHYTGADSFALNGAFLGYGVDYANLGVETANMIAEILLDGKNPGELAVRTFDNGTATVNTEVCEKLDAQEQVGWLEVNISCPNVHGGGAAFGADPKSAAEVTKAVRAVTKKPIILKLSPTAADIAAVARACEDAGADGVSLINTLPGMRIDLKRRRPLLANTTGGMSGPGMFPLAVRMVYQVYEAVSIPIVGMGGVTTAEDVIELMLAVATAIGVGAANLVEPYACKTIIEDLPAVMERYGMENLTEIIGGAHHG